MSGLKRVRATLMLGGTKVALRIPFSAFDSQEGSKKLFGNDLGHFKQNFFAETVGRTLLWFFTKGMRR